MINILSKAGKQDLQRFLERPTLVGFDYDGTLAPLDFDPEAGRIHAAHLQLLDKLKEKYKVAVISGRGLRDLRQKLGFKPHVLIGNHGMEGLTQFKAQGFEARKACRAWKEQLLRSGLIDKGIWIEDKRFSLSVHYSATIRPTEAKQNLWAISLKLSPRPRLVGGKLILNLVHRRSLNKGTSLHVARKRLGLNQAIFVGDDLSDEDAFKQGGVFSIRVGKKKDSAAKYYLSRQAQIGSLLLQLT